MAGMQTAAAREEAQAPPIKGAVRKAPRPTRLEPPQQERLRDAKFDLQKEYRLEIDENAILQQFFDEAFDSWLRAKLNGKKGQTK